MELKVLKYLVEEDPDDSFNVVHMQVRILMHCKGLGSSAHTFYLHIIIMTYV